MIPEPERLYGGTIALAEAGLWITSPFNAAGRPALLYPDLVKLYAAHAATIKAGPSRAQKTARFPWQTHLLDASPLPLTHHSLADT